ncbi:hypothetical protein N2384_19915 [Bacillus paralicheniformis]|uniref:hypothetical protein n=1 Tax=Bacillus paralicheniformis TaxID=1648923 RepID=UPI0021A838CE|nr:hypothetical protein [Bacillus paralicheniformis]UWS60241.1 hypothetical protein N2384_19915 [Bacillus paralicheniformis]
MTAALVIVAYLLVGVLTNMFWARGFWKREKTQEWIERSGYDVVAHEAKSMRTLMLGMWPLFLPWMILTHVSNALNVATDPHIEHRKQFRESMRNYTSLRQLEIEVHGHSDANRPQVWCACLEGLDED